MSTTNIIYDFNQDYALCAQNERKTNVFKNMWNNIFRKTSKHKFIMDRQRTLSEFPLLEKLYGINLYVKSTDLNKTYYFCNVSSVSDLICKISTVLHGDGLPSRRILESRLYTSLRKEVRPLGSFDDLIEYGILEGDTLFMRHFDLVGGCDAHTLRKKEGHIKHSNLSQCNKTKFIKKFIKEKIKYEQQDDTAVYSPVQQSFTITEADTDYVMKLSEDISIFIINLNRAKSAADYLLAAISLYQARSTKSIVGALSEFILKSLDMNFFSDLSSHTDTSVMNAVRSGDFEAQDMEYVYSQAKMFYGCYKNFKTSPLFKKFHTLFLNILARNFLEVANMSFETFNYDEFEAKAIKRDFKDNFQFIDCIMDTAFFLIDQIQLCFTTGSLTPLLYGGGSHAKWFENAHKVKSDYKSINNPDLYRDTAVAVDEHQFLSDLDKSIETGNELMKQSQILDIRAKGAICSLVNDLKDILREYLIDEKISKPKVTPFLTMVFGTPGIGKSSVMNTIRVFINHLQKKSPDMRFCYVRNPESKHWNGFKSYQHTLIIDDVAFKNPDKSPMGDVSIAEIIQVKNPMSFVPEQASLEDKGKNPFLGTNIVLSTNTDHLNVELSYAYPMAVMRRFDFCIEPVVKEKFRKSGSMMLDSNLTDGTEDYWEFIVFDWVSQSADPTSYQHSKPKRRNITRLTNMNKMLKYLKVLVEKQMLNEERMEKSNNHISRESLCSTCGVFSKFCDCFENQSLVSDLCSKAFDYVRPAKPGIDIQFFKDQYTAMTEKHPDYRDFFTEKRDNPIYLKLFLDGCIMILNITTHQLFFCSVEKGVIKVGKVKYLDANTISNGVIWTLDKQHECVEYDANKGWAICSPLESGVHNRNGFYNAYQVHAAQQGFFPYLVAVAQSLLMSFICDRSFIFKIFYALWRWQFFQVMFSFFLSSILGKHHFGMLLMKIVTIKYDTRLGKLTALNVIKGAMGIYIGYKFSRIMVDYFTPQTKKFDEQGNSHPAMLSGKKFEVTNDEKESVWTKVDYETTSFEVSPKTTSFKSLDKEQLMGILSKQIYSVTIKYVKDDTLKATDSKSIVVCDNIFAFSNHCVPNLTTPLTFELTKSIATASVNMNRTIIINESQIHRYPEKDLCLIQIQSMAPHKDIRDIFVKDALRGSFNGFFLTRKKDGFIDCNRTNHIGILDEKDAVKFDNIPIEGMTYQAIAADSFYKGYCGTPLIGTTMMGPVILGLHYAGGKTGEHSKYSRTTRITNEFIHEATNKIKHHMIDSHKPDFMVQQYGYNMGTLHHMSPFRYHKTGEAAVYGTLNKPFRKGKSLVEHTPMFEIALEYGYTEKFTKPVMNSWRPWQNSLKEIIKPIVGMEEGRMIECGKQFLKHILNNLKQEDLEELCVMQIFDVVNGVSGARYIDKINRNSSAGYPFNKSKKHFLVPADATETAPDPVDVSDVILDQVLKAEELAKLGVMSHFIASGSLKDEALKWKKVLDALTRVFYTGSFPQTILVRKYYLTIIRLINKNREVFECGVGTVAQSEEWKAHRDYLTTFGEERCFAGDYAKFDKRMYACAKYQAFYILIEIARVAGFEQEELNVMWTLAYDIIYPTVEYCGDITSLPNLQTSGHPLTVVINSLVIAYILDMCFQNFQMLKCQHLNFLNLTIMLNF